MSADERTVRDIGEFGLIAALRDALPPTVVAGGGIIVGIGDDAAVWEPAPGAAQVVTTDSLVEGIHFRRDWTDWMSLGHKILAVNVSNAISRKSVPRMAVVESLSRAIRWHSASTPAPRCSCWASALWTVSA